MAHGRCRLVARKGVTLYLDLSVRWHQGDRDVYKHDVVL